MFIKTLSLKDFRNYEKITISPQPGLNILYGKNAQGKTNLVEAIYYLSTGKSFRTNRDIQMISFEKETAQISASYTTIAGENKIDAVLKKDGTKSFNINAMPIKKLGHLFGHFSCIAFTPEDIKAVKETPALRRRLIDLEIAKIKPAYFFDLKEYFQILSEKNALLKKKIGDNEKRLIHVYNEQLAGCAKTIIRLRRTFLEEMAETFDQTYQMISDEQRTASIIYRASVESQNIEQAFLNKLNGLMTREIEYRQSLFGPHKEDFVFMLGDKDLKLYGSQGQQRSVMLAYKLAVLRKVKERTGESPVLILDDVFSELDFSRQNRLTDLLVSSQVFITTSVPINVKQTYQAFVVENGQIKSG